MIIFLGVHDWVIRNLLCSSFAPRARELGLNLHAFVFEPYDATYGVVLKQKLGMTSEPHVKVNLEGLKAPRLEKLARRANLYRRFRSRCGTFPTFRRKYLLLNGKGWKERFLLEAQFILGRVGGQLGWEFPCSAEFYRRLAESEYVREVCVPRLQALKPTLLVSTSPETPYDLPWMAAAGLLGIPRAVWIRSWDNLSSKCQYLPEAESYLVWSELMEQELRRYFPQFANRQIVQVGVPQFDGHVETANIMPREKFCALTGLDPHRPIILYCTSTWRTCQNEYLVVKEVEAAVEALQDMGRPQLLVRLHPYSWLANVPFYEHLKGIPLWPPEQEMKRLQGGHETGLIDDNDVMLASFYHQAVNINIASTVTLDSAIFNRPIINVAYEGAQKLPKLLRVGSIYTTIEHYVEVVKSGAVDVVWNRDELMNVLRQALAHPERRAEGRRRLIELECGQVDGQAGIRLANALAVAAESLPSSKKVSQGARSKSLEFS